MTGSDAPSTSSEHGIDRGLAPPQLTGRVLGGVAWKAASHTVAEGTRVVVTILLARLLSPADYGVAGMALVVTSFVTLFADPSLGAALIQRPTIDERDRSTVFWTALAIGLGLTALGIAFSGVVARFFGEPEVKALVAVTSVSFTFTGLSVAPRALLLRQLAYRATEIREITSILIGGSTAVILALLGFGPWAIVSNFIAYTVASTALVWLLVKWRPRFLFSFESLRNLGGFSSKVFAAGLLSWGNLNVDNILVGRILGPAALGAYSLAYNVMFLPMARIGRPLAQVLGPAYTRIQTDRVRLERVWLKGKRMTVALVAPGFLAILVVAPDLVHVAFGSKWDAAVWPLRLLCVAGVAHSLGMLNWGLLSASGSAGTLLRLMILTSIVTWIAFFAGVHWGITGVAGFYAIARWLLVLPEAWLTANAVSFPFRPTLLAGVGVLPVAIAAAVVSFGFQQLLVSAGAGSLARLLLVLAMMSVSYLALVTLVTPGLRRDFAETLRQRRAG
jgi:O-antigen/teichoic acid export membrane protein